MKLNIILANSRSVQLDKSGARFSPEEKDEFQYQPRSNSRWAMSEEDDDESGSDLD